MIMKCMLYICYLRWIFTKTKWCGKSQCKETTITPTMLNLKREKRMAAICFFVWLYIESLSKISYTLTFPGWLPMLDTVIHWELETFRIWINSPLCISKASLSYKIGCCSPPILEWAIFRNFCPAIIILSVSHLPPVMQFLSLW